MLCKFPQVLSKLRIEKGISQKKAADELGISSALLSHYENGKRECGLDFLLRISEYYSVSVDYLLGKTSIMNPDIYKIENEAAAVDCVLKTAKQHNADVYGDLCEIARVGIYRMARSLCDTASRGNAFAFELEGCDHKNLCQGVESCLYARLTSRGKEKKKLPASPHKTTDEVLANAEEILKKHI